MIIRQLANGEESLSLVKHIEEHSFRLGNDPPETEQTIAYLMQEGAVFAGYEDEIPVGIIELISLRKAIQMPFDRDSALSISVHNGVYSVAHRFGNFSDIIIHHGIGIHKDHQSRGNGKELLQAVAASDYLKGKTAVCMIDAANGRDDSFNAPSFALHLNYGGFIIADMLCPPVFDNELYCAAVVRADVRREGEVVLVSQHAPDLVSRIKQLTDDNFAGFRYDRNSEQLYFQRLMQPAP